MQRRGLAERPQRVPLRVARAAGHRDVGGTRSREGPVDELRREHREVRRALRRRCGRERGLVLIPVPAELTSWPPSRADDAGHEMASLSRRRRSKDRPRVPHGQVTSGDIVGGGMAGGRSPRRVGSGWRGVGGRRARRYGAAIWKEGRDEHDLGLD